MPDILSPEVNADLTPSALTALYQQTNNEVPPAKPQALTTSRIFKAMRAAYQKGFEAAKAEDAETLQNLTNALHRLDTVIIGALPTFEVVHEGNLDAVVENLVLAITAAGEKLKAAAPDSLPDPSTLPTQAFGLMLHSESARRLAHECQRIGATLIGGYFGGARYCAGLPVRDAAHAFQVGNQLGLASGSFGEVRWDSFNSNSRSVFLVFEAAHVSQGPATSPN